MTITTTHQARQLDFLVVIGKVTCHVAIDFMPAFPSDAVLFIILLTPSPLFQFASPSAKKINEAQTNAGNNDNDDTLDEELLATDKNTEDTAKEIDETEVSDKAALFKEQLHNVLRDRDYYA